MNKKAKTSGAITLIAIIGVLFVGLVVYALFFRGTSQATIGAGQTGTPTGTGGGAVQQPIVTTNPTIAVAAQDASKGSAVGNTIQYSINGGGFLTASSSTVVPGQLIEMLVTNGSGATAYHAQYIPQFQATVASFPVPVKLWANASSTSLTLFNTNGVAMTNLCAGATTVNQTVASGGTYNMKLRIDGTDKASTQDMTCILEGSDASKIDQLILTGFGSSKLTTGKPNFVTSAGLSTNPNYFLYAVAPIEGASSPEGTITAKSVTGQSMAGTNFTVSCYTKEHFIDSLTGKHNYDIVDSDGATKKFYAKYTLTGCFT